MLHLRYLLLLLAALPCLPFLFAEGKRIRQAVPQLPEPTDTEGVTGNFAKTKRLLVIGESTMAGVGVASHREGFAGHLAAGLGARLHRQVEWTVVANSGATASSTILRLEKLGTVARPDLIVIGLGGNDSFRFRSPWRWRQDVQRLIRLLQGKFPGAPIVFANLPPTADFPAFSPLVKFFVGAQTGLLQRGLASLVRPIPQVFFDDSEILVQGWVSPVRPISLLFSDGVHPSGLTYRLWANELGTFIAQQEIVGLR